mgnify:CR=1 FL=1
MNQEINSNFDPKYLEDLNNYYSIKKKFQMQKDNIKNKIISSDNSIEIKKQIYSKAKLKCVNCGNYGGTLFKESEELLRATCGNVDNPCNLDLVIKRKKYDNIYNLFQNKANMLINHKNLIIKTKLDFLFNYLDEDKAIEAFEKLKTELSVLQESYNNLNNIYENIVNNEENNKLINEKNIKINNVKNDYIELAKLYNNTGEIKYMKDAVNLYISKIEKLTNELINLKYKYNYIEDDKFYQEKYNIYDLEIIKK